MEENVPKLGLAMGSGGARGLAHIGVLQVLEEEKINVDYISGSSMGALIGGLYACGVPLKYMVGIAEEIDWEHLSDFTFPRQGLLKGKKVLSFLEIMTKNKKFKDSKVPFAAVACNIENGEHVILKKGSLAEAIRASTAIPGVFVPYVLDGQKLVDGGIVDPVPVSTCYNLGADIVIGVDVGIKSLESKANNIFDVLLNTFDIMQLKFTLSHDWQVDLMLKPELENVSAFDLKKAEFCIDAGREAALNSLDKIKKILKEDNYAQQEFK